MRLGHTVALLLLALGALSAADSCLATTRYVSDVLHVNLLAGKGQGEKIKLLKSNEPLEVIEEVDGFMRVQTEDGSVGWVSSRFVMDAQPKSQIIQDLQSRLAEAEGRLATLATSRHETGGEPASGAVSVSPPRTAESWGDQELTRQYDELLKKSRRAVELVDRYDALKSSFDQLSLESDALKAQSQRLGQHRDILWFLAGGGVFGAGWLAGKLSRRRKQFNL